jgi:outer membrane scaffolding protein for murein synthesis (MipA/OmpV family)
VRRLALPGLALAWAGAAHAQAAETGWSADLGAVARLRPDHLGGRAFTLEPVPVVEVRYGDRLQLSLDDGAKWSAWQVDGWSAGPVLEYRQAYADRLPPGAHKLEGAFEIGGFAAARFKYGELELRLRRAANGYQGWSGDLSFDTGGQVTPNWKLGVETRLSWADSAYSDAYFGLRPAAARRMGLPRFQENDMLTAGVEFDAARRIDDRTQLVAIAAFDRLVGPLDSNPILQTRNLPTLSLGVTYHWPAP